MGALDVAWTIALLLAAPAQAEEAVEAAVARFRAGHPAEASLALQALVENPDLTSADHSRARYYLARCLHALGLLESAQLELLALMAQGSEDPYFRYILPGLLDIARQTGDPTPMLAVVDLVDPTDQPPRAQPVVRYLQGLGAWQRGDGGRAHELLDAVPDSSDLYPRARYLQGLILAEHGKDKPAVAAFRDAAAAPPTSERPRERDEHAELRSLATLQLARVYDELGQLEDAEGFYAQVPRGSEAWPAALEAMARIDLAQGEAASALRRSAAASWPVIPSSSTRRAAVPRASELLHAQALQALCRPGEARAVLRNLEDRTLPLWSEMGRATAAHRAEGGTWHDPASAWASLVEEPSPGAALDADVLAELLEEGELLGTLQRIRRIDEELRLLSAQDPAWRRGLEAPLHQQLEDALVELRIEGGRTLLDTMATVEGELGSLLTLSQALQGQLVDGEGCPEPQPSEPRMDPDAWGSEQREAEPLEWSWPYTGEIWADEL
jgi:tetratricopeptide (TPR) repeat protein